MRFLPTIDLWSSPIVTALQTGQLRLLPGQWVKCGPNGAPARWVALRPSGVLWVAHSEGERGTGLSFRRLCKAAGIGATR